MSLIPVQRSQPGPTDSEHVNVLVAMAGLSHHTQRAYRRWIRTYLSTVNQIPPHKINLESLPVDLAVRSLGAAYLKTWLGQLKTRKLGKQSIMQAKASVVWLAQFMADMEQVEYAVPSGLSRVKTPRAESGQRPGRWLTDDEIRQLIVAVRSNPDALPARRARDSAMVVLLAICGLRREEIASTQWQDLGRQGRNAVLRVHGKGEKLRTVKLPDIAQRVLEEWAAFHRKPQGSNPVFTRIWPSGTVLSDGLSDRAVWEVVQRAVRRAGLPTISPHDLRRSFARGAYNAGVSFELIRQTLGHSNIATTERYVNSALELDRAATDIWANRLDES